MSNEKTIGIKNVSSSMVVIAVPEISFRRELTPGRELKVTKDVYDDLAFDNGFMSLVRGHYLKVSGLEEDDVQEDVGTVVSADEISKMLDSGNVTAFAKFLPTASQAERETAAKLAIEKNISNPGFTVLINKYCNVDVVHAIDVKNQISRPLN